MLTIEKITSFEQFLALKDIWKDLLLSSGADNFYLSHEWISVWWKNLSAGKKLYILCIKDSGKCIAFVPLMVSRTTFMKFPVRKIEFIGSGWGHGGIILTDKKEESLKLIFEFLRKDRNYDLIVIARICNKKEEVEFLTRELIRKRIKFLKSDYGVPFIKIEGTWEEYLASFRSGFRKTFQNRERYLRKKGEVVFERFKELKNTEEIMAKVFDVSLRSWKAKCGTAIASSVAVKKLYSDLSEKLNENGWLDVSLLNLNNNSIAYIFGARYGRTFVDIDIAFDLELSNTSPGIQLHNLVLKELFSSGGITEFDFVMKQDYKKDFTSYEKNFPTISVFKGTLYSMLLFLVSKKILPLIKKVYFVFFRRKLNV